MGGPRARLALLLLAAGSCWRGEAALKELGCETSCLSWKVWGGGRGVHVPTAPQGRQPPPAAGVTSEAADSAAGLDK